MAGFFASVDQHSRRDLEALAQNLSTHKPQAISLPYPEAWWLHLSNFQKAIRRGDVGKALDSAERLHRHNAVKLRRRLAVVALEDVSFGDLRTVATVLAYAASTPKEPSEQDLGKCLSLVKQMSETVKDRVTAELVGASIDAPAHRHSILKTAGMTAESTGRCFVDEEADPRARCVAGLALAGVLTLDDKRVGVRDRQLLVAAVNSMDVPDAVRVIVESTLTLGGELAVLAINVPILYRRMARDEITVREVPLLQAPLIEGILAPAYDRHTRSGLKALAKFRTSWSPLAKVLAQHADSPRDALKTLAFRAEGSLLDKEISCPLGDSIYRANEEAQADALGMDYASLRFAKWLYLDGLPVLNGFRREAAASELMAWR